jgi:hypothetical protein
MMDGYDLILMTTAYKIHAYVTFMCIKILKNLGFRGMVMFTLNLLVRFRQIWYSPFCCKEAYILKTMLAIVDALNNGCL